MRQLYFRRNDKQIFINWKKFLKKEVALMDLCYSIDIMGRIEGLINSMT